MTRIKRPKHTRQELDRLNDIADALASAVGVAAEEVGTEPTSLRISLTLAQAERLIGLLYPNGQRWLRPMNEHTCHWVEHHADGDYQCDLRPGHYGYLADTGHRMAGHNTVIRLTERLQFHEVADTAERPALEQP
jgi:hypothetical protein